MNRYSQNVTKPKSQGASQVSFEAHPFLPRASTFGLPAPAHLPPASNRFGPAPQKVLQMLTSLFAFYNLYRLCSTRLKELIRNPTSTRPWLGLRPSGKLP